MSDTRERLRAMLVRDHALDPDELTSDASLDALGVDSLGLMELMFNVEEELGIDVPSERVELHTLGEVADWIDRLAAEQGVTKNEQTGVANAARTDVTADTEPSVSSRASRDGASAGG